MGVRHVRAYGQLSDRGRADAGSSGWRCLLTIFRFNKTVAAIAVLSVLTMLFFTFVNLTQRQAVGAMFVCIFAGLGYWYAKKPWR